METSDPMGTTTVLRTPAEETLLKRYPAEKASLPGAPAVASLRDGAFAAFEKVGLPHRRVEAWKYTDLRANLRTIAAPAGAPDHGRVQALPPAVPGDGARRIVVANGRVLADLSDLAGLEPGVSVRSLADALTHADAAVLAALEPIAEAADNVALAVNTAFMSDGVVVTIADGVRLERPIEIAHVTDGETAAATAVRNLVMVGAGATATVIETVESTSAAAHQSNIVTMMVVGDGAAVDHIRLQLEPFEAVSLTTLTVSIGANARFETFNAALGAGLARAQVFARFTGAAATGAFRGATLLSGRRHADTTLVVTHDAEGCESRELYKAVVDDEAKSVFQGRINVPAHAQKTDARMMTASLLLSDGAEAYAKPELEIFADDVQCGHGATCGALDDDLLFYMLARGISKTEAEKLLIIAYLGEAIDEVHNEAVREMLIHRIEAWLGKRVG
ncbi:Fe-S cluster assembly protein SufD [Mongoliimonas terrestris]|uniref:Fe-S cluster assembly protein SufD n=1 Tax=Mongoliimonas terrestris TaxID=1709001 RepID=UPI000AA875C8|nr:Fe-S cluster assembly protein SufD [Mongoliimonas terrestris]